MLDAIIPGAVQLSQVMIERDSQRCTTLEEKRQLRQKCGLASLIGSIVQSILGFLSRFVFLKATFFIGAALSLFAAGVNGYLLVKSDRVGREALSV